MSVEDIVGTSKGSTHEAAGRYAGALIGVGQESDSLDAIAKAIEQLAALWPQNPDLQRVLNAPVAAKSGKAAALAELAQKLELPQAVTHFLQVVALAGRAKELPAIFQAFSEQLAEQKGIVRAQVQSAVALQPAQLDALNARLKNMLGREIALDSVVKPELLGGLTLKIGSKLYDASVAGRLDALKRSLIRA